MLLLLLLLLKVCSNIPSQLRAVFPPFSFTIVQQLRHFSGNIQRRVETWSVIAELAECSPIIIQNSKNPWSRKNLDVRPTVQGATFSVRGQLYHGLYLIISPLHGHGEVANENPLILPRTLSIEGSLVLKRRAGKKMRAPLLGLPKSICYGVIDFTLRSVLFTVSYLQGKAPQHVKLISWSNCDDFALLPTHQRV